MKISRLNPINLRLIGLKMVLLMVLFFGLGGLQTAQAAGDCRKTGSVCINESCKVLNGQTVCQCWSYQDSYTCWENAGENYCGSLVNKGCGQLSAPCIEYDNNGNCAKSQPAYDCSTELAAPYPANVSNLGTAHQITQAWDESACKTAETFFDSCKVIGETCTEPGGTRIINGVAVTQSCWKKSREMECVSKKETSNCEQLAKRGCTFKAKTCLEYTKTGACSLSESKYSCLEHEGQTVDSSSCSDKDFSKAITGMEMAREMGRYFDPKSGTFFNGDPEKCSVKLSGALDGVFGGDCCKPGGEPGSFKDAAIVAVGSYWAAQGIAAVGSQYTYAIFMEGAASLLSGTVITGSAGAVTALAGGATSSASAFGVTISTTGGNGLVVAVNPVALAAAVAVVVLQQWLECSNDELTTAMRNSVGLCHFVGSYKENFTTKQQSYCCYISRLARIVNEQGKAQLKKSWGDSKNPTCSGFTPEELSRLDFAKMDLSEFYAEIVHKMPNTAKIEEKAKEKAEKAMEKGENSQDPNYYELH
jgi:conjugal transfer mating pair stabilization protein TraN